MQYKIIVDKQPRSNPSSEIKEYVIDIEELRVKGDIYDSLVITKGEDYVMRRLELTKYHKLNVLDTPIKEPLIDLNIELFEGDNYIYLMDMVGNKFYAEYIVKNDFTDMYVTRNEMNSSINQKASQIELSVNQKLSSFSTTEEMNSTITQTANEIKSIVSVSIGTVNLVSNSDFSHQNSEGQYDLKNWTMDNNESSEPVTLIEDKTWLSLFKQTSGQMSVRQALKPVNKNENYTLSFKLKNTSGGTQNVGMTFSLKNVNGESIKGFDYWPTIEVTEEVQTFNYTFQTPDDETLNYVDFGIQTYNTAERVTSVLITDIQLEIGTIATEWRASQTDYYYKIEQYSKMVQTVDRISSEVALKAGKDEMNSKIEQTAEEINMEVSKKVGNNEIISKINQSAEAVGIQANKIELSANDILNLIAGNAINLTSKNITITSNAFKVDKNGKVTCSDIDITGGRIILESNEDNCNAVIKGNGSICEIYGDAVSIFEDLNINIPGGINTYIVDGEGGIVAVKRTSGGTPTETRVFASGITTPKLTQTSLKSKKKNIKKLKANALDLIKKSDICLYNLKGEKAKSKKHIGLVIGDGYNCPEEVISEDGQGVEQYSMTSLAWKAIQEQQEIIEKLNNRIEELEAK